MKTYQSHKQVEAAKITYVGKATDFGGDAFVTLDDGAIVAIKDLGNKGVPQIGDYVVRYIDGHLSWSPAKAFEEGYREPQAYVPLPPDPTAVQLVDSALKGVSKGACETGGGFGCRDYWVTLNGVEHFISMQRSKRQIMLDQGIRLPPSETLLGKDRPA